MSVDGWSLGYSCLALQEYVIQVGPMLPPRQLVFGSRVKPFPSCWLLTFGSWAWRGRGNELHVCRRTKQMCGKDRREHPGFRDAISKAFSRYMDSPPLVLSETILSYHQPTPLYFPPILPYSNSFSYPFCCYFFLFSSKRTERSVEIQVEDAEWITDRAILRERKVKSREQGWNEFSSEMGG